MIDPPDGSDMSRRGGIVDLLELSTSAETVRILSLPDVLPTLKRLPSSAASQKFILIPESCEDMVDDRGSKLLAIALT